MRRVKGMLLVIAAVILLLMPGAGCIKPPAIAFSPSTFSFSVQEGGSSPPSQILNIWNSGSGELSWSVSSGADWLHLSPSAGVSTGEVDSVTLLVDIGGMSAGNYATAITISVSEAGSSPQTILVNLAITQSQGSPYTPSTPSGPDSGYTWTSYTYFTSSTDPDGDQIKYTFDWGDDSTSESGFVSSGVIASRSHSWSSPGTYYIRAKATDSNGASSGWSSSKSVIIEQTRGIKPNTPSGPSTGTVGESLTYTTGGIISPPEVSIQYRFDWGDGSYSSWSSSVSASHSWSEPDTYVVRAQAKDGSTISEWSLGKVVEIKGLSRQPFGQPEQMKQYITPNDPEVKAAVNEILGQQLKAFSDFETLRDWVSRHVSYKSDQNVHGVSEYWQLPSETLRLRTGDCEDFAILLCSLLRAYGISADQVYVAAGVSGDGTYHAYLVERWYQGVWRVTEPQCGAWVGVFLADWLTTVSFETLCCFNDQHYFEGPPTLPPGVYEFQLSFLEGASATFERYMSSDQVITASVEWLEMQGQLPDFSIFGWGLKIYDASGNTVFSWFGQDLHQSFHFSVQTSGKYKVQVYIGGVLPVSARLTMNPPDWSRQ